MSWEFLQTSFENAGGYWLILITILITLLIFPILIFFSLIPTVVERKPASGRISLQLGPSFRPSDRFSGFVDDNSSASFVILEFPVAAYEQMKSLGENPAALAAQGVTDVQQRELSGRTGDYVYMSGVQKTALVDYAKFILIFRQHGVAAMITANVPQAALQSHAITTADIEYALTSATVASDAGTGSAAFHVSYLGPFEEDLALMGNTRGYRLKASGGAEKADEAVLRPYFLVASSMHKLPTKEIEAAARKAFQSIEMFKTPAVLSVRQVRISGRKGVEITGEATDARTGEAAGLYQVFLARHRGGYFRLAGYCPKAEMPVYLPEFRKIADSFIPGA
jgi:hypothetical protein